VEASADPGLGVLFVPTKIMEGIAGYVLQVLQGFLHRENSSMSAAKKIELRSKA
jgi:hypothetical protein